MRTFRRALLLALAAAVFAPAARAQSFGLGIAYGLPNDVTHDFQLDNFKPSEVVGWFDYRMEERTLVRLTYGNMRTFQTDAGETVETSTGSLTIPEFKERIMYGLVGVSYTFFEGFYTSGIFAGIGGYHIRPDTVPPEYAAYSDENETVFGWHGGVDGEFRLRKYLYLSIRFTYHNISAHPHRQFVNMDFGLVGRF